jgi:hypothetical protein
MMNTTFAQKCAAALGCASLLSFAGETAASELDVLAHLHTPGLTSLNTFAVENGAFAASRASVNGVQTELKGRRDAFQGPEALGARPLAYSQLGSDAGWPTVAYTADAPSRTIVAAPPPAVTPLRFGAWVQGFGDYEDRDVVVAGVDLGRTTRTGGAIAGVDAAKVGVFSDRDVFVIGVLGGYTSTHVRVNDGTSVRVEGGGMGVYGAYVSGGFSIDGTAKVDFFDVSLRPAAPGFSLESYVLAGNLNYKFNFETWWLEPTVGVSGTWLDYGNSATTNLGVTDAHQIRVQGGLRVGTSTSWGTIRVEPTLTGLLYSDVEVSGSTIATATTPLVPTDEGKVFAQLVGKLNFLITPNFSAYVEGEIRGREDVFGAAGRAGLRVTF